MPHVLSVVAAATLAAATPAAALAAAEHSLDTFSIDVVLSEVESLQGHRDFHIRLEEAAADYCRDAAPRASRSALQECQGAIIEAVHESLAETPSMTPNTGR